MEVGNGCCEEEGDEEEGEQEEGFEEGLEEEVIDSHLEVVRKGSQWLPFLFVALRCGSARDNE